MTGEKSTHCCCPIPEKLEVTIRSLTPIERAVIAERERRETIAAEIRGRE